MHCIMITYWPVAVQLHASLTRHYTESKRSRVTSQHTYPPPRDKKTTGTPLGGGLTGPRTGLNATKNKSFTWMGMKPRFPSSKLQPCHYPYWATSAQYTSMFHCLTLKAASSGVTPAKSIVTEVTLPFVQGTSIYLEFTQFIQQTRTYQWIFKDFIHIGSRLYRARL